MESSRPSSRSFFVVHPVVKLVGYYGLLAAGVAVLYQLDPNLQGVFTADRFAEMVESGGKQGFLQSAAPQTALSPAQHATETIVAMLTAVVVMLPVTWVFILTRSKKGFSQSTAQTLIFLPIVVAGIIMLVKTSVALAFGLGGVVGAVSFRNRLDDPKDAMFIFLGLLVGLASGVQAGAVALAVSLFFNLTTLIMWQVDFGRMPAQLEAGVAQKRLERAKASSSAPADFLKVVDQQLLKSMTPDQLQALSERAAHRSRQASEAHGLSGKDAEGAVPMTAEEEQRAKFDSLLRVMMQPDDAAAVRAAIEQVLGGQTKRWEFEKAGAGDGGRAMAQYKVKFKKSIPSTLVIEAMRRSVLPRVATIEVRDA
jgi:hypothetical protein